MPVDTSKVLGRRTVHYSNLQALLKDAERLASAQPRALGNWSQGQIYKHLAVVMAGSIDGFSVRAPWFVRLLARLFKKRILSKPMAAGYQLPAEAAAAIVPGETSVGEGLDLLRKAIERLQTETQRYPSPFLGKLTIEEWNQLHLRHAELHMSFLAEA